MILKAPRAGTVKTRLALDIGVERATLVYRAMVGRLAKAIPLGWNVSVHFSPPDAGKKMEAWLNMGEAGSGCVKNPLETRW